MVLLTIRPRAHRIIIIKINYNKRIHLCSNIIAFQFYIIVSNKLYTQYYIVLYSSQYYIVSIKLIVNIIFILSQMIRCLLRFNVHYQTTFSRQAKLMKKKTNILIKLTYQKIDKPTSKHNPRKKYIFSFCLSKEESVSIVIFTASFS